MHEQASQAGDGELVAAVLAGDRTAFAAIYDRYADRLHDYAFAMLRDHHEAADATQDTFVLVAQRLGQLNDPDRLRPWLYAVTRSVTLRTLRARKRVVLDDEVDDMPDTDPGPQRSAEQAELRELVWNAAAGLGERDQELLTLHLRHGLEGAELAEALGVKTNHVHVLLNRLREQVERSLGALLVARQGRDDCPELQALLGDWDGTFSPLIRKRVARHVESCDVCGDRRKRAVSPWALLGSVPIVGAPPQLRADTLGSIDLVAHHVRTTDQPRSRGRWKVGAIAAVLLLLGGGAIAVTRLDGRATSPSAIGPSQSAAPSGADAPAPVPPVILDWIRDNLCRNESRVVTAHARGADAVLAHWRSADGTAGVAELVRAGDGWTGRIGPIGAVGPVQWHLEARSGATASTSPAESIVVVDCTGPGTPVPPVAPPTSAPTRPIATPTLDPPPVPSSQPPVPSSQPPLLPPAEPPAAPPPATPPRPAPTTSAPPRPPLGPTGIAPPRTPIPG